MKPPNAKTLSIGMILLFTLTTALLIGQATHAQDNIELAGTVAVLDADRNIHLIHDAGAEPVALTSDARPGVRSYAWPTWSTDGRLAFFSQEAARREEQDSILLRVFITPPDTNEPSQAFESTAQTFTYAYWAPANCSASEHCRDLAVLTTTSNGLSVLRVRDETPDFSVETIGLGGPFYYSYSPDASQMIWQRFGLQLDRYSTETGEIIERLPDTAGFFQAPMWSPVDDRLLFSVINDDNEHDLVIADGADRQTLAANQRGILSFAWAPDGNRIAYKADFGPVIVLDASTGREISRSYQSGVVAFFWSPDSTRIAYLTIASRENSSQVHVSAPNKMASPVRQDTAPAMFWNILDIGSGTNWTQFEGFMPTREMLYFISFFDQFAQSHRLWSPDSRYVVYASINESGDSLINLLDTSAPTANALTLAVGRMAIWSYHQ